MSAEKLDLHEACAVLAVHQDWRTDHTTSFVAPATLTEALDVVIDAAKVMAHALTLMQGVNATTKSIAGKALRKARALPASKSGSAA
jgi:hypothetical protein